MIADVQQTGAVRTPQASARPFNRIEQLPLAGDPRFARLREAGSGNQHRGYLGLHARFHHLRNVGCGSQDNRKLDRCGNIGNRPVTAHALDRIGARIDQINITFETGFEIQDLLMTGPARGAGSADDGDAAWLEESPDRASRHSS